jgi:hypothetical protein
MRPTGPRRGEDGGSQFVAVAERDQVPTGNDDGFDTETHTGQLLLELLQGGRAVHDHAGDVRRNQVGFRHGVAGSFTCRNA